MSISYLGGLARPDSSTTIETNDQYWEANAGGERWFLTCQGSLARQFVWDDLTLLVRGYVRHEAHINLDLEAIAEELRARYLEQGELAIDRLEGSFTLALLDSTKRRLLLYRNLVGAGFTYYAAREDQFCFGSNLTEVVDSLGATPTVNREVLPAYFLYRAVPGRDTLFEGVYRLLPGEQVTWQSGKLKREQRITFADLRGEPIREDAGERLRETVELVLRDGAAHRPGAVNLLSGGVDSSYLQAAWDWSVSDGERPVASYSLAVDHPRCWADTDYAMTASQALGTRHSLLPVNQPYAAYLVESIATTGEPPNHVQSAYFRYLAREIAARGHSAGICGEGADSLFGLGLANQIHNAQVIRAIVPVRMLRRLGQTMASAFGWPRLAATFHLAGHLHTFDDPAHPVNQVAMFAHLPAVEAMFGVGSVREAMAARRSLVHTFAVGNDPMEVLHAAGFLGEAMDSASLWTALFNSAGIDLLCPFLDSRMMRMALSLSPGVRFRFRRPKSLLRQALADAVGPKFAQRPKLGFGQPIFEWLAPGGSLRRLAEESGRHPFVDPQAHRQALERPNWFLYSLVCFDVWHRLFIERSLPRCRDMAAIGPSLAANGLLH